MIFEALTDGVQAQDLARTRQGLEAMIEAMIDSTALEIMAIWRQEQPVSASIAPLETRALSECLRHTMGSVPLQITLAKPLLRGGIASMLCEDGAQISLYA